MIVLHYTAMSDARVALDRLCMPEAEVSSHYLVAGDGTVTQLVAEDQRAWHAGAGCWGAVVDVNSRSIGIELDNTGFAPFSEPLMRALEPLLDGIMARWSIPPERVIGHSDCAPGRKIDPGARFDWRRLALGGRAIWPGLGSWKELPREGLLPEARFLDAMRLAGYRAQVAPDILLAALRLRLRPWADGPRDAQDDVLARGLATHFPVDAPGAGA